MNSVARISEFRVLGFVVLLLLAASPAPCQDNLQFPDGFTYIGSGTVEGTDRLVLTSPTSAVLLSIVPDGTEVRRGDLIATIDDTRLNTALIRQQTATKQAADSWKLAEEQLEIARELEAIEVDIAAQTIRLAHLDRERQLGENGTHEQRVGAAEDAQQKAQAEQDLLTDYLKALHNSPTEDLSNVTHAKLKLISARSALRQAEMRLDQLRGPVRAHLQAELDLAVLRAEANKLKVSREQRNLRRTAETHAVNRKNVLETLTNKLKEIEEQIAQCQIFAPNDGVIRYLEGRLAQGVPLRTRQKLFVIVNTDTLLVRVLVDGDMIRGVKPDREATIRCHADRRLYPGVVKEVIPTLDDAGTKYTVAVELKPPHVGVRLNSLAHVGVDVSND